jgi:hypothetical protein
VKAEQARQRLCAKKRQMMVQGDRHIQLQLIGDGNIDTSEVLVVGHALDLDRDIVHVPESLVTSA